MIANKGRVVTSHSGVVFARRGGGERKKTLVIPCPFTAQKGHYSSPIGFDYCVLEQLGYTLDCLFSRLLLDYDYQ